jgi:uncharacterized membrane protein YidH (DUF202 family)
VLAAGLAFLPVLYLRLIWPTVLAFVPTHFSGGQPDHFVERAWLQTFVWYPALAFVVLTFLPQVHAGESIFWSNARQRLTRLVVVFGLALAIGAFVRNSALHSRASRGQRLPAGPGFGFGALAALLAAAALGVVVLDAFALLGLASLAEAIGETDTE